jgi:hypothetical protein
MIRNKIKLLCLLVIFLLPVKADAFLKGFLASPCGCGWFQAGIHATAAMRDEGRAQNEFRRCLTCKEIKEFADIAPYLRSFINQLPEEKYASYQVLLQNIQPDYLPRSPYATVILNNAEAEWQYNASTYENFVTGHDAMNDGKRIQGSYKKLWKFLYLLGHPQYLKTPAKKSL